MAISFVNSAGATATSITIPTGFVAGDMLVMFAYSTTTTAPTLPTGWTSIFVQTTNSGLRAAYKVAVAADVSGTWTGATFLLCGVYRGVASIGGANSISNVTSTTTTISGIATFTNSSGTSWAVSVAGSNQSTSMTTPTATTSRTNFLSTGASGILVDSNAGVTAYGQKLSTNGVTAVSGGGSVELVAAATTSTAHNLTLLGIGS